MSRRSSLISNPSDWDVTRLAATPQRDRGNAARSHSLSRVSSSSPEKRNSLPATPNRPSVSLVLGAQRTSTEDVASASDVGHSLVMKLRNSPKQSPTRSQHLRSKLSIAESPKFARKVVADTKSEGKRVRRLVNPQTSANSSNSSVKHIHVVDPTHLELNEDGAELQNTISCQSPVLSLACSPGGSMLAVGLENGSIRCYDTVRNTILRELSDHSLPVHALCFSPGGSQLISGDDEGRIVQWNAKTGNQIRVFPEFHHVHSNTS